MLTCFLFGGALFLSNGQDEFVRFDQVWNTQVHRGRLVVDAGYKRYASFALPEHWASKPVHEVIAACHSSATQLEKEGPDT